ncbi:MAG: helix-turn-helix domain-containing protein [Candidatus Sungiibacteriota bacterium]
MKNFGRGSHGIKSWPNMTQSQALSILKTGANVFLTGEPGSGKTHTINEYVAYLRSRGIEPAITASTGIAATHINGMTIHSWSGIGIKTKLDKYELDAIASREYVAKRVWRAKVLVIDEVSMLPPDTLSLVDAVCREVKQNSEPFGGVQVVMVGDFFQLPPVVKTEAKNGLQTALVQEPSTRFAYDSTAWKRTSPIVCYITEQYRQDDNNFLALLSAIRSNAFDSDHLRHIETRKIERHAAPNGVPKLFSHNADVDRVNDEILAKLPGEPRIFTVSSQGPSAFVAALKKGCLSPETLYLKAKAAVMFTKNNPKKSFVNGTLGTVEGFDKNSGHPIVKMRGGKQIEVEPMDWTMEENGKIHARITQLPLRLAWAITVHKSQGMSLDEAAMDLSDVFEFGQGYVALSRVRRLSGLYLLGWNERAFQVHPEVLANDEALRSASRDAETVFAEILPAELEKMHKNFIVACGGNNIKLTSTGAEDYPIHGRMKKKLDTHSATLILWNEKKTISQIAQARGLKEQTILNHVEKLVTKGKVDRKDISRLITPALSRELPKIHAAFRELGTDKLSPVFEKFGGAYSYNELRIARLMLNEQFKQKIPIEYLPSVG